MDRDLLTIPCYYEAMKLILAQGNPGTQYDGTRHNTGFFMIDRYAAEQGASWSEKAKFHALVAELDQDGEKVILAKPTTYYNETGRAARALSDFYKIAPEDILVIHDELALPFGTIRTRSSGSDAGNNGIKSLNTALGQGYKRLRVGIFNNNPELGKHQIDEVGVVMGKFTKEESVRLVKIYKVAKGQVDAFVSGSHSNETTKI